MVDRKELLTLALLGLEAQQGRIMDKIADVRRELSQLAKPAAPTPKPRPIKKNKRGRKWTPEQRKAAAERMRQMNIARKKPVPKKRKPMSAARKKILSQKAKARWAAKKAKQ
ncbi:MAG: hypothetical protein A2751_01545 [Candidatus Doudnabacteria bacterium RIFCSPHIGHO2_01_FULL_46_14]|uniref:Uncharacterized protein n=1 Tax=Candidatus Doudnabacteria bacterium RIFCSPHIGHO2_01_FULL_46_14 TaxID=1817824 RepID=A0A1F5NJI4_9BACT|nr:MAG: hypothetical protein A2751_01545 [Candidatus Doudnabacteria bacterium RIFCSPHIGHO2_01_FULL_46_14]